MGENGSKNFRKLEEQGADFKALCHEVVKYCGIDHSEKDVLYGNKRIFLNEKFKISLDKALLIKQKKKKEALKVISRLYFRYQTS